MRFSVLDVSGQRRRLRGPAAAGEGGRQWRTWLTASAAGLRGSDAVCRARGAGELVPPAGAGEKMGEARGAVVGRQRQLTLRPHLLAQSGGEAVWARSGVTAQVGWA